jgi:hypothetical protein
VSSITLYSFAMSIEATTYRSLKGTGKSPSMTQDHLQLAYEATTDGCQPRTSEAAEKVAVWAEKRTSGAREPALTDAITFEL